MVLNTIERLVLLSILPKEGDFTTLKILRNLRDELSFTEEEYKQLQFENLPDGKTKWDVKGDIPREIIIGEKATDIIVSTLKEINNQKKLTEQDFSLYEKFIGE